MSAEAWSATTPPQDDEIVYTSVEPTSDRILIDGAPSDIAVMPDFDAEAPVVVLDVNGQPASVDDASIVDIDGEVTELSVVSSTDRAALASCWRSWVAPGTGTWYNSVNGCAFIGLDAATTVGYSWTVDSNSIGAACLQGRGYKARHLPGGGNVWDEYYDSIGCGGSGSSGGGAIKWGNVASNKGVKMMSTSAPSGAAGMFS
ncbi:hypothetical protein [Microbacterium gubbeenense]|uniref:hypothetical protein n=1 Tax=Microbacterium gubbeenense TaxID=159896 RepID=UPI0012F81950|nr:hypothetical protein [Microbacterium gubbeenense]